MTDQTEQQPTVTAEGGDASLMNSEIVEKLKWLDYEKLFTRVNGDKKYDDPVTMANNLLTEMKNMGINCQVPPNQLRAGFGVPICSVLLQLIDKALEKKGMSFKKPNYEEKSTKGMSGPEIEEETLDPLNTEIDYGDNWNQEKENEQQTNNTNTDDNGTGILFSGTTTEDWHRELEKVNNKLKIDYAASSSFGNSEWRVHVATIKENEEKFAKAIPDSRAVWENLSSDIDKSLEKITKKEEIISKNHSNIISSYKEKHKVSSNQFDEYKQWNESVERLKRDFEEVTEKISQANERYDQISKTVSDTSAVGNTKKAIEKLQNENATMEMKWQIWNHSLLKYLLDGDNMKGASNEPMIQGSMYEEEL